MKIIISNKNIIICEKCKMANTFVSRFKGLMLRKSLPEDEGLYLKKCNSIHMFFMKFPIDVLFIDKNSLVVHTLKDFKPWKVSQIIKGAIDVLELASGTIDKLNIMVGDHIIVSE